MLPVLYLGGLLLAVIGNQLATPLRSRFSVYQSDDRLVIHRDRASLRLDALVLLASVVALAAALLMRTNLGALLAFGFAAFALWQIISLRRAPGLAFDRLLNAAQQGSTLLCSLDEINAIRVAPGTRAATLEIQYRTLSGDERTRRLLTAPHPKAQALAATIRGFLQSVGHHVDD